MRILHVNKFFDLNGGAEIYMHRLMEAQREAGHEVHAFSTASDKNLPSTDEKYFVTRNTLNKWQGVAKDAKKAAQFIWNREAERAMRTMLKDFKPDIVHVHNIYHHLSTSILRPVRQFHIPCVQTLHDYKLACPSYTMYTQGAPCERCRGGNYLNAVKYNCVFASLPGNLLVAFEMGLTKLFQTYEKSMNAFICPSMFMKEKMEDWGEPASKLVYAPNPVNVSSEPAQRGGGYILYAGRLSKEKGLASFLQAAVQIPELQVKIAGRGPEEELLQTIVREAGAKNVEFLGFQSPDALSPIRGRADALVMPSVCYENASTSLLEGMADGIPCIATRIGGNPELIQEGEEGWLVTPGDVKDWVATLRGFLRTPDAERARRGLAARRKILETRTWPKHLTDLDRIYLDAKESVRASTNMLYSSHL